MILVATLGFGQDVQAVVLKPADSQALSRAYADYLAAKDHWEGLQTQVRNKEMQGWGRVKFSKDFRVMLADDSFSTSRYSGACVYPWYGDLMEGHASTFDNITTSDLLGHLTIGTGSLATEEPTHQTLELPAPKPVLKTNTKN